MTETNSVTAPGWRRRLGTVLPRVSLVVFLIGLVVRLTVRDRFLVANTINYATPWSVLCVLGCIAGWQRPGHGPPQPWKRLFLAGAVLCGMAWIGTSWFSRAAVDQPDHIRVVTWNLAHGNLGLPALAAAAAELRPDIAIFVEADPANVNVRQVFRTAFPNHHVFMLGGGIVLVSQWPGGEARAWQFGPEKVETRVREIEIETPWGTWTVFGCDVASDTLYQREPHLRELARRISLRKNPVIVAGDFNTPLDSVHFRLLRDLGLKEAFETAGSGYLPTWPLPCPVLSLDQIWLDPRLEPVRCVRDWNWRSDHAAVVATVRPSESAEQGH